VDFVLPLDKGVNTALDQKRLPAGFMRECAGAIYIPDDPDRLHKIPDRSTAGTLPGAATAANTKGLQHLEYENGDNQLLLFANGKLYKTDAAVSLTAFSSIQNAVPADFALTGDFLKVIPSGRNEWIAFTGANERPVIIDEDGNARYISMKKPSQPTLAAVSGVATEYRPNSSAADGANAQFDTPANAYDSSDTTAASKAVSSAQTVGNVWDFAATGVASTSGHTLYVKLGASSLPPDSQWEPGGSGGSAGTSEAVTARLEVAVSEDNGSNFTTFYTQLIPTGTVIASIALTNGLNLDNVVKVRARFVYSSGTSQVIPNIYDIWVSSGGSAATVTDGTYYYAITAVYKRTLTSGAVIQAESAPSDSLAITLATKYGVTVTLGAINNGTSDGIPTANLFYRIYRSTSTGSWPNLGLVVEVPSSQTTWTDTFEIAGTTLGVPSINTVDVAGTFIPAAGQVGAIFDACFFQGAIVYIPASDRRRIQWTLPGTPEYAPLPAHDLTALPSSRNDELCGVVPIADVLIIWSRTRVLRLRGLPMADRPLFDLGTLEIRVISPNEGLAGTPKSYITIETQSGYAVVVWVNDNGIWMVDGSLKSEDGMGAAKLTTNLNWREMVDIERLDETHLSYDPVLQLIHFDYYDRAGNRRTLIASTAPDHWMGTEDTLRVPKFTGPHELGTILDRPIGELSGPLRQWSLSTTALVVYNERTDGSNTIQTFIELGWNYLASPRGSFQIFSGLVYHSDWGASEGLDAEFIFRTDETGIEQHTHKKGLSLTGDRLTNLGLINRSGNALKLKLRHAGKTTSIGTPLKALGPLVLSGEVFRDTRED
jgi:hypothetical protein